MLKIKQLKCNDILHADSQHTNGQPVLIFFFRLWSSVCTVFLIGPNKQVAYGSGVLGNRNAFSTCHIENNKPEDKGKLNSFKKQCCTFLLQKNHFSNDQDRNYLSKVNFKQEALTYLWMHENKNNIVKTPVMAVFRKSSLIIA